MAQIIEQRSPEWFDIRRGKATSSRIAELMARTKSGYGASRANLMAEYLCERLTGVTANGWESAEMRYGREIEPEARANYEFTHGVEVELVGFIDHPIIAMSGASPDGFVGSHGSIEIKCPNTATHVETLLKETVPGKYYLQMQWQMACTGRTWCDFVSYDKRLPPEMQLWVKRVYRTKDVVERIETEVITFLTELDIMEAELRKRYLKEAA